MCPGQVNLDLNRFEGYMNDHVYSALLQDI